MLLKGLFCICIQVMLFKAVFTQCIPPSLCPREPLFPANLPFVEGCNLAPVTPFYGRVTGGNIVLDTSAPYAPIGPAGVTIFSDNLLIEGAVFVSGNLPFLGTVGLEGILPATGNSAVSYECGTGNFGSVTEPVLPVGEVRLPVGYSGCNMVDRL